jgi:hypothetical protein
MTERVGTTLCKPSYSTSARQVRVNRFSKAVLGWSAHELACRPFWEIHPPDDRDQVVEDRDRLLCGVSRRP